MQLQRQKNEPPHPPQGTQRDRWRTRIVRAASVGLLLFVASWASPARGDELARRETERISGIDRPSRFRSDTGRDIGNVFLFVPRHLAQFLFWSASITIGVIEKQPVVPRAQNAVSTHGGRFAVLPTLFAETRSPFDVGARMLVDFGRIATGLRVGFGGIHYFEIEPRIAFQLELPLRSIFTLEGLYKVDNSRYYYGVGQVPETDSRNHFVRGRAGARGRFFEQRARWIGGYAIRLNHDFELVASGSIDRRSVDDAAGAGQGTLSGVFTRGTVPGSFETRWTGYVEAAARADSRPTRGRPSPGVLGEIYAGSGHELGGRRSLFLRSGGRVAGFIPLYRRTNILSPKLVVDGIAQVGTVPISFNELASAPDFRGFDDRRDNLSVVASLDYRWLIVEHVGMSVFIDSQVVSKSISEFQLKSLRFVGGTAIDLHTDDVTLGQLSIAAGAGGVRLSLSIGTSTGYGDRQHRK